MQGYAKDLDKKISEFFDLINTAAAYSYTREYARHVCKYDAVTLFVIPLTKHWFMLNDSIRYDSHRIQFE